MDKPEFQITPTCSSDESPEEYIFCNEEHATRWYVSRGWRDFGWFDARDAAEAFVEDRLAEHVEKVEEDRAAKFTWGPDDLEHH